MNKEFISDMPSFSIDMHTCTDTQTHTHTSIMNERNICTYT